jgi:hypothetical protein
MHEFILVDGEKYTTRPKFARSNEPHLFSPITERTLELKNQELTRIKFPYGLYFQISDSAVNNLKKKYNFKSRQIYNIGLSIEEDIAIIEYGRLVSAFFAFPSKWDPMSKRNKTFQEIHEPVADNKDLMNATDRIISIMSTTDQIFHRYVWTISYSNRLSEHIQYQSEEPKDLSNLYFRYEHQKFTSLVNSESSVFTVKPYVIGLDEYFDTEDKRRILRESLKSMSDNLVEYKGLREIRSYLVDRVE